MDMDSDVVVIVAGLAGLGAATALRTMGRSCVILEASWPEPAAFRARAVGRCSLLGEPVRQAAHEIIERRRLLRPMYVRILQQRGEVMNRVIQRFHRSREFFTDDSWQLGRHPAPRCLLVLLPFRQGSNRRSQLGNGRRQAVRAHSSDTFIEFPAGGMSASPMHAVHGRELLQHLLHSLSGKELVDETEKRVVRVHQSKDHRLFDEREQIGGNKSDDGRQKFSGQPVDEPLNSEDFMSVSMEFAETDKQGQERQQQPDAGHQRRQLAVEGQVHTMAQERVLRKNIFRASRAENARFYEPRDMFQNQGLAELRPGLPKHGFFLHGRFEGVQVVAVDTGGGGYGLPSRRRESHQRTTRESLTIDVSAIMREGDQHRAYSIERPLRASHFPGQSHDVPEKEEHNSERPEPAQHRALGPSEEGCVTTQKFPQTGRTDHCILSSCTTDSSTLQSQV